MPQRARNPDQRQSDQRRRIAAIDAIEQRDAEPLAAKTAGTIEWTVELHIARNFGVVQRAESHNRPVDVLIQESGLATHEHNRREKCH